MSRRKVSLPVHKGRGSLARGAMIYSLAESSEHPRRPVTRADCLPGGINAARPCPYAGCRYHMYLDVNARTGTVRVNFADLELWELPWTCVLDIADEYPAGMDLEPVAALANYTTSRVRQITRAGSDKVRASLDASEVLDALRAVDQARAGE